MPAETTEALGTEVILIPPAPDISPMRGTLAEAIYSLPALCGYQEYSSGSEILLRMPNGVTN